MNTTSSDQSSVPGAPITCDGYHISSQPLSSKLPVCTGTRELGHVRWYFGRKNYRSKVTYTRCHSFHQPEEYFNWSPALTGPALHRCRPQKHFQSLYSILRFRVAIQRKKLVVSCNLTTLEVRSVRVHSTREKRYQARIGTVVSPKHSQDRSVPTVCVQPNGEKDEVSQ
jgi:hypothetical protein